MAEYIKREDVLKILSEKNAPWNGYVRVKELPTEPVIEPSVYVTNIKKLVKDYDALEDRVNTLEGKLPKWIPVTERLPKKVGWYLVVVLAPFKQVRMYEFYPIHNNYGNDLWRNNDGDHVSNWFVSHWMPLPEPPKDGET